MAVVPGVSVAVLAVAFLACSGAPDRSAWTGTVDTLPDGTVAVSNPSRPATPLYSAWRLEVEARIGSREGRGPAVFVSPVDLAVDGLDRVWVLDRQVSELRVFTPDGEFVRAVGREGGGPGEFRRPIGVSPGPEGTMWVMDAGNGRISVFDKTGEHLAEHPRRTGFFLTVPCRCGFDRRGRFYDHIMMEPPGGAEARPGPTALVRMRPGEDGLEVLDTLPLPRRPGEPERLVFRRGGTMVMSVPVPYAPKTVWSLGPDGNVWYSPQTPYRIYELTPRHDTLRVIEREFEPLP